MPNLPRIILGLLLVAGHQPAQSEGVRLRDLAVVSGARDNQLVGYGLVVGLAGDGDRDQIYTKQSVANALQKFGVTISAQTLSAKNVAAVMITADIGPFAKSGSRLDIQVASIGDAKSLQGGVLLQTPLVDANGEVYAVAQGPIAVGGFSAGTGGPGGATVTKNHPTVGQITGGALVEREIPATIVRNDRVELLLRDPGFTSAARVAAAINLKFAAAAAAVDSSTIRVQLPEQAKGTPVEFIAMLEDIEVNPETPARVIINERTGTIVATARIRIANCAVSHGNITISVASTLNVSQPSAFADKGRTVVTPQTETDVNEGKSKMVALPDLPTVEKVATALNSLGVTPRDMMAIFQSMRQAGALQAEVLIR